MDVHSPKIMTRACLRICLKIMANLSCRRFAQENPPFIDAFLLFQTKHLHLQWIFQAVDIASIPSVRKHSSKDHLNEEPQNQIPPDESKGPWRGHRVIFWPFFLRAGDHGDMIFEWKWAQNTVTTDVFCIWCLWNRGETHIFASCFVMMLEKHWQAPQKNKAQPHKTLAGTKQKKNNNLWGSRILSRCWDFVVFCFLLVPANVLWDCANCALVFLHFLVPVQVWWACLMLKRKDRIYSVLCSFLFTNHVPMVPKGNHRKQSERCALPSGRSDFEIEKIVF